MVKTDFIIDHNSISVKCYDGTMRGNVPHYVVKEIVSVNTCLVKEKDMFFEHIINFVMKTGVNELPKL